MTDVVRNDEILWNISANVSRLLRDRGWSQTDLARKTGDPLVTISQVVRGLNMPGVGILARVAEAFDVSMDRLAAIPPDNLVEKPGDLQHQG